MAITTTTRRPGYLERGLSTAVGTNVTYRLGKLSDRRVIRGTWLDCGCADGGYSVALSQMGANHVVGIDLESDRVAQARQKNASKRDDLAFCCGSSEELPFRAEAFDGVLLNEVFEHVGDEEKTLTELRRVLRPGGVLALMSPNRWFPFEGHGMRVGSWSVGFPVPLLPWWPSRWVNPYMTARNYWPSELQGMVTHAGFEIVHSSSVFPVFEVYPWLPRPLIQFYRTALPVLEMIPFIRRFGVSTLVLARRPA
jgi:SAM-dependent methyltransferase